MLQGFFEQNNSSGIFAGEWRSIKETWLEIWGIQQLSSSNYSKNSKETSDSLIKKAKFQKYSPFLKIIEVGKYLGKKASKKSLIK